MNQNQYLSLFIFVYFMSMPVLSTMMPNVQASFRGDLWIQPGGWIYKVQPWTRILIATVFVVCAWVWEFNIAPV